MPDFLRPHHLAVASVLEAINPSFLAESQCFFGGGTCIALMLGEYRESRDIDFLCASRPGFRRLRETVTETSLGKILRRPLELAREVRADRDGIRTFIAIDNLRIKFEIVLEARIDLQGANTRFLGVPVLTLECAIAEKLLANTDRGLDESTKSRDLIDLAFLAAHYGAEPFGPGIQLAETVYGNAVRRQLDLSLVKTTADPRYLSNCARALGIDDLPTLRKGITVLRKFASYRRGP
jgi:Nucleotidyl transferase AbiEii toxin, Type IV TA system